MDQALPKINTDSDYNIIYDPDDVNLYKLYEKYQQLSKKVEERLEKIKAKKRDSR